MIPTRFARVLAPLTVAAVAALGIVPSVLGQDDAATERGDLNFIVVSHGQASDPFWSVVQQGVAQAAEDMGVTAEYQAPPTFDMAAMAQLIDAAVATEPDGLVVSVPDASALGPSIEAAVEAGIPVVTMNSGSDVAAELGALTHVGQTEFEAGFGGGERMAEAGATNALCVNQEVGNTALDLRCQGFTEAMDGGRRHGRGARRRAGRPDRVPAADRGGADRGRNDRRRPHPRPDRGRAGAGRARGEWRGGGRPDRDVRPVAGGARGDPRRRDALRDRPAAVPPGLPADRAPDP
jgi:hypothetical protein